MAGYFKKYVWFDCAFIDTKSFATSKIDIFCHAGRIRVDNMVGLDIIVKPIYVLGKLIKQEHPGGDVLPMDRKARLLQQSTLPGIFGMRETGESFRTFLELLTWWLA